MQLALALLQLRNSSAALCEHGLLLLERKLQLQVLLTGALTNQSGAVKLLLQRGHLKSREGVENMCLRSGFWMNLHEFSCIVTTLYLLLVPLQLGLVVLLHLFYLLQV